MPRQDVEQLIAVIVDMGDGLAFGAVVASRTPMAPPVSALVAFRIMSAAPGIARPWPGPRTITCAIVPVPGAVVSGIAVSSTDAGVVSPSRGVLAAMIILLGDPEANATRLRPPL